MNGYVKIISLRRWNWLPWFKRNYYVPMFKPAEAAGIRVPMFDSYDEALHFLSIMERVR